MRNCGETGGSDPLGDVRGKEESGTPPPPQARFSDLSQIRVYFKMEINLDDPKGTTELWVGPGEIRRLNLVELDS
jgi:hypothetical protein